MKRIAIYILLLCSVLSGCDILDLKPKDIYGIENFWENKNQVDRFMSGLHNRIRMRNLTFLKMGEFRGGYLKEGPQSTVGQEMEDQEITANQLTSGKPGLTNFGAFYTDIMQINHAIDQINTKVDFLSGAEKNYYLGMLHGIRAFYYFHLFRTWGGMPLVDYPDVLGKYDSMNELNKARASERETYDFIRKDVERSIDYFKDDEFTQMSAYGCSFWTKQASYMLKAEVNLWGAKVKPMDETVVYSKDVTGDLQEARNLLLSIETKTSLQTTMADLFQTKDNSEIIYAIRYALGETGNTFASFLYPPATFGTNWYGAPGNKNKLSGDPLTATGGSSRYEYKFDLYKKYSADDIRRDFTFMYFGRDVYGGGRPPVLLESINAVCMRKFLGNDFEGALRRYVNDFPIYRKADLLLMLAEIYNELDDTPNTKKYIDLVRDRAYGAKASQYKFTYVDKRQAEEEILLERDKEFVAEGKRWYDVRRMLGGEIATELSGGVPGRQLWPIAESDLAKDPLLKQNDAYLNN